MAPTWMGGVSSPERPPLPLPPCESTVRRQGVCRCHDLRLPSCQTNERLCSQAPRCVGFLSSSLNGPRDRRTLSRCPAVALVSSGLCWGRILILSKQLPLGGGGPCLRDNCLSLHKFYNSFQVQGLSISRKERWIKLFLLCPKKSPPGRLASRLAPTDGSRSPLPPHLSVGTCFWMGDLG